MSKIKDESVTIKQPAGSAPAPVRVYKDRIFRMIFKEKKEFLESLGLEETGLAKIIRAGYALLGLETYFTAGPKEVRAWTFLKGSKAPVCAGIIHSDFERGFIRAETISYEDFIKYGSEQACKDAGKMRSEGKEYVVKDGDMMNFLFNV